MPRQAPILAVGADGCPDGWVAVACENGRFSAIAHLPDIASLVATFPQAEAFGIDIPLSFPTDSAVRPTDREARRRLSSSAASLFPVPPRIVLEAATYADANALSKSEFGRGISRQSYALRSKILEAVGFIEATGENRLYEVHPELSFRLLARNFGHEVTASKKTWTGAIERLQLLEAAALAPPLEASPPLGRAAIDDVLDAAVAAWTAHRITTSSAETIAPPAEGDEPRTGAILA
ncbi:MAG: DUF429 domain-containing protein [Myxococcales bacterium]|nr:DUF429 domain-containing protein [Myxococcales bacterium]